MTFGIFELTLTFPADYPFQPPSVEFLSEMFHPNISPEGRVPLTNWSPAHDVSKILTDIQSLLSQPTLNPVANKEAAQLYREDRREYVRRVNRTIEKSLNDEWVVDIEVAQFKEKDQAKVSDTKRKEDKRENMIIEEHAAQEIEENVEMDFIKKMSSGGEAGAEEIETEEKPGAESLQESNTARKPGLKDKIKRLFRK